MWGNITGAVGAAISKVQKLQNELESQLDQAVGADGATSASLPSPTSTVSISGVLESTDAIEPTVDATESPKLRESVRAVTPVVRDVPPERIVVDSREVDRLSAELQKCREEQSFSSHKVSELSAALKVAREELKEKSQSEVAFSANLRASQRDNDLKSVELNKKQAMLDSLTGENVSLQQELRTVRAELDAAKLVAAAAASSPSQNEDKASDVGDGKAELETLRTELLVREQALQSANARLDKLEKSDLSHRQSLSELEAKLTFQSGEVTRLVAELTAASGEAKRLNEVVAAREGALETANTNLAEAMKASQDLTSRVNDLRSEVSSKDAMLKRLQSSGVDEAESARQLSKALETLKEKEQRLAAFEQEGAGLAKKHSEMEQMVRKSQKELKERAAEIAKLKESKEQLVRAIEEQQEVIKKHEADVTSSTKNLSAMQAVSNASTEKLARLEAEVSAKLEEIASQRRALENAWNDNNEAKRTIAELRADRDDLRRQIGEGTSKVMETESTRRDIEQREAVLRATSRQLQDSLQRQMQESAVREERLRDEVVEMRKRWQDAVASREAIASDLGSSTAPLLRQISSLQEALRQKSESWQGVESALSERALRAENKAEMLEHKKAMLDEQLEDARQHVASLTSRGHDLNQQLQSCESSCEKLKRAELVWIEEKTEVDAKLSAESVQRQNLFNSIREMEMRHKLELKDVNDAFALQSAQKDLEVSKLKRDVDQLSAELNQIRSSTGGALSPVSSVDLKLHNPSEKSVKPQIHEVLSSNERMLQRRHQHNEELLILQSQLQQLQASRNALLEEVSYLSHRNSQLEDSCVALPQLTQEVNSKTERIDVLLTLLGEKEEELEALVQDMREVKHMYQEHMQELLTRIAPP